MKKEMPFAHFAVAVQQLLWMGSITRRKNKPLMGYPFTY